MKHTCKKYRLNILVNTKCPKMYLLLRNKICITFGQPHISNNENEGTPFRKDVYMRARITFAFRSLHFTWLHALQCSDNSAGHRIHGLLPEMKVEKFMTKYLYLIQFKKTNYIFISNLLNVLRWKLSKDFPLVLYWPFRNLHHHHFLVCLATSPQPPPKQVLHTVLSSDPSYNFLCPLVSLKSSSSCWRLFPRLRLTSVLPFDHCRVSEGSSNATCDQYSYPSFFIVCKIFLSSLTLCNTIFYTIGPTDLFHLSRGQHFKTFQVLLLYFMKCPISSTVQR
jgi:hypothetical protein